ncbi:MAG: rod shape-determining protein MreC [Actinomycetota bacterium]|nr:MAG: rod shape-determining protein MreC [Actinomycetota bacterium]
MRDTRRTRLILGLVLLTALTLIVLDLRGSDDGPLSPLRSTAAAVFGPIERGVTTVVAPIGGFFSEFGSWGDKDDRIRALEEENAALRSQQTTTAHDAERLRQLDGLLRVAAAGQYRTVPAQVIAVGPAQGFAWTVTIDAGSDDGLQKEMSVINGDGLVGYVREVSPTTSRVVLIVDATVVVGARLAGTGQLSTVSGTGRQDQLELQMFSSSAPVVAGDRLVTFGSQNGLYPPGIPIGAVTDVKGTTGQLTRVATVKPFADMASLDIVGVIVTKPRTDPRDAVLPPAPAASTPPAAPAGSAPAASPAASATSSGTTRSSSPPSSTSTSGSSASRAPAASRSPSAGSSAR